MKGKKMTANNKEMREGKRKRGSGKIEWKKIHRNQYVCSLEFLLCAAAVGFHVNFWRFIDITSKGFCVQLPSETCFFPEYSIPN